MREPAANKLLTIEQAAERLSVKPSTIRSWILRGVHLDVVKVGRCVRITEQSIQLFIERNTIRAKTKE